MENTVWSGASLATSVLRTGVVEPCGSQEQRKRRPAEAIRAMLGQLEHGANKRVYVDDTPAMAAATFAGMSGLRTWSPPV